MYRARDRETGAVVALKILRPDVAARLDLIERFKAELLLARKITHKNVCRVYDLHRFGDIAVIAMEYVEGESLRAILQRFGDAPRRRGQQWASQICSALTEAHAQGVIHRDLKPENILIDRQGAVKVMDFGIARSIEGEATQTSGVLGTPAYMSPEQAQGKPADARSDIYSLGLILYEMFTGQTAFRADTPVGFAMKQIHETPPSPSEVEPDLPGRIDRAIQKCVEKDPKKRFQTAAQLEAALAEKPAVKLALPPGEEVELPLRLARWQRSDWLLALAALVGLALFFPSFNRTSLAPRSKVSFDRSVLRRIAEEHARRIGAPIGRTPRTGLMWPPHTIQYDYVAEHAGARAALELTSNPVPYWVWQVGWENGTTVRVDNRGSLVELSRDFPPAVTSEELSMEDAKPRAEKALREFLDRDPALLRLENALSDSFQGHKATSFTWLDPKDFHGLRERYVVRLVGSEVAFLESRYDWPADYVGPEQSDWQLLYVAAVGFALLVLGVSQRKHVDLSAGWRKATCVLLFVLGGWWGSLVFSGLNTPLVIFISSFLGLSSAFIWFFASIAVERSIVKLAPAKVLTFTRLFDRRVASAPCGLAILRGTLIGVVLLGVETFLVWAGASHVRMWLDSGTHIFWRGVFLSRQWPSAHVVLSAMFETLNISVLIALAASLIARFARRAWVAGLLVAALGAVILPRETMGAVKPWHWQMLLLFLDCLVLIWTLTRFDILTLVIAVFTFIFCSQNSPLLVMFESTGAVEQWVAFVAFGSFVLAATAVAFQSSLRAGFRRLASAFE